MSEGQDQWLDGASGKIVKVISALLEHLPAQHRYKVLFMDREIKEILASQQKMLYRRGEAARSSDAEMETQFREHLRLTKYWLARQPNMDVLYVDYNKLMANPDGLWPDDRRFHRGARGRVAHAERPERDDFTGIGCRSPDSARLFPARTGGPNRRLTFRAVRRII